MATASPAQSRYELIQRWRSLPAEGGAADGPIFVAIASDALDLGEPLLALDICRRGRALPGVDDTLALRMRQLQALALARSGASGAAQREIESLVDEQVERGGAIDSEALGIHARTFKDLWLRKRGTLEAEPLLRKALSHYELAHYASSNRPWTGVNVATLRLAAGRKADAEQVASDVLAQMNQGSVEDEGWSLLTKAECHLVMGNPAGAAKFYASARHRGVPPGRLASARRNAMIAMNARGQGEAELEGIFPRSEIIIFAGHRIDATGRPKPRFPVEAERAVADAIRSQLGARLVKVGVSSAADGADILFLEAMLERGAEVHVMLPAPPEAFVQVSVNDAIAGHWRARFERVLSAATTVTVLASEANDPVDFVYASDMLLGLAKLRATQYDCRLNGIAVWDGEAGLPGGTGSAIRKWTDRGVPTLAIDPGSAKRLDVDPATVPDVPSTGDFRVSSLLFADAQGFSKLSSRDVSIFTDRVLSPLGSRLDDLGETVLCRNTWGDAVYVAFERPVDAARFANDVVESCAPDRIRELGLPEVVKFRVSLHAGPVREVFDPVSKKRNLIGPHVSWAARIEPITPAGSVYSSEAFAALCSLDTSAVDIEFEYVGHVPLAKGFATLPTYRVSRVLG